MRNILDFDIPEGVVRATPKMSDAFKFSYAAGKYHRILKDGSFDAVGEAEALLRKALARIRAREKFSPVRDAERILREARMAL